MKKIIFTLVFVIAVLQFVNAQTGVSISNNNADPHSSSILDVQSTEKGILIPRMLQTERDAIITPATGLMIFQTDATAGFYYYNGTAWTLVGDGTGGDGAETKVTAGTGITVTGTGTTADPYIISEAAVVEPTYTIGLNSALGGYVFYITPDDKHGLVCTTSNLSASGTSWYDGYERISTPANYNADGKKFTDWRLPTKYELTLMYAKKAAIGAFVNGSYWGASENTVNDVSGLGGIPRAYHHFGSNATGYSNCNSINTHYVRAVRSF